MSVKKEKIHELPYSEITDYLFIVDLKKKSPRLPPARLLSPDRADMDCGIDCLSREM